ncbi:MAG: hypothetical protein HYY09_06715 [Firmicutes bacterium]|nr:hypothetical protein [Bacillota bacterium]
MVEVNPLKGVYFFREMAAFAGRPAFLLLNLIGVTLLAISQVIPEDLASPTLWDEVSTTIGSALLTIGLTLPIALFYQIRSNAEAFKILDTCSRVGIDSIFVSRKEDSKALRDAIDEAMARTNEIELLGIAFRTFFDASSESTKEVRAKVNSPSVPLRVLMLDPGCQAAKRRAAVEIGSATIDDIKFTLDNGLVATAQERLRKAFTGSDTGGGGGVGNVGAAGNVDPASWVPREDDSSLRDYREKINLEVHLYTYEPGIFMMRFSDTLFAEQYHRGRPAARVPVGSCIGKYMPVVQYRAGRAGFEFLQSHFATLWKEGRDVTDKVLKRAVLQEKTCRASLSGRH